MVITEISGFPLMRIEPYMVILPATEEKKRLCLQCAGECMQPNNLIYTQLKMGKLFCWPSFNLATELWEVIQEAAYAEVA